MKLPGSVVGPLVNQIALAHSLRPDVVMCLILKESKCDPAATRYEPHIHRQLIPKERIALSGWKPDKDYNDPEIEPSLDTEKVQRAMSWGLMQVLGETARWCGKCTRPFLSELANPEIGIEVGCRVFSHYLGRAKGDYTVALAMYNAGSALSPIGQTYSKDILDKVKRGEHIPYFKDSNG